MTKGTHKICIILIIVPSALSGTGQRFLIEFQLLMSQNEVFSVRLTLVSVRSPSGTRQLEIIGSFMRFKMILY